MQETMTAWPPVEQLQQSTLGNMFETLSVALVCGTGGVGKTTMSAALAISEARKGRDVCVLTIDPAPRLTEALGLEELDRGLTELSVPDSDAGGSLVATKLDPKHVFDELVAESTSSAAERDAILDNMIYRQIARQATSIQEYMALERMYELDRSGQFDLIVVDTPPMSHAKDFLTAPDRVLGFFDSSALSWFIRPSMKAGSLGGKLLGSRDGLLLSAMTKITGSDVISDVASFLTTFLPVVDQINDRVKVVRRILEDEECACLTVTNPTPSAAIDLERFFHTLADHGYGYAGTVINRIEAMPPDRLPSKATLAKLKGVDDELAGRIYRASRQRRETARRHDQFTTTVEQVTSWSPSWTVPNVHHSLEDPLAVLAAASQGLYGD